LIFCAFQSIQKEHLQISMLTVIIPTSGTGSRLGNLTKYTNKSLIQLGDKLAICYIIERYPLDTTYIILLGHFGSLVREFLTIAYPERNFIFCTVDIFEGIGSSLGYSLLKAKKVCQTPFFFHCCDTITLNKPDTPDKNTLYVAKNDDYNSYASIYIENDTIKSINKKGFVGNTYIYTGLSFIKDYKQFWSTLESLYLDNKNNFYLGDTDVHIKLFEQGASYTYSVLNDFYDTGNLMAIRNTKDVFQSKYSILEKNNESLCFLEKRVIKFVSDKETNRKRALRGQDLYPLVPKIYNATDNYISMDLISGELLSESKEYGEIYRLLNWANTYLWINEVKSEKFKKNCYNFYKKKTFDRLSSLSFLKDECISVNGISTGTIYELLESLDFESLCTDSFYKFHGDFILDNILKVGPSQYVLLDWRHEFDQEQTDFGDKYYDLAKLRHNSIFNHKNISNKLYDFECKNNEVVIDIKCNYFLMKQHEQFDKFVVENGLNLFKIKVLTSLIWLNMSALYEGKLSFFLFYFGKLNLYLTLHDLP